MYFYGLKISFPKECANAPITGGFILAMSPAAFADFQTGQKY